MSLTFKTICHIMKHYREFKYARLRNFWAFIYCYNVVYNYPHLGYTISNSCLCFFHDYNYDGSNTNVGYGSCYEPIEHVN